MPRVRRRPPVRLSAPPDAVRAAAFTCLDATPLDDGRVRVAVADHGLPDVAVDLELTASASGDTLVATERVGRVHIPFFGWAFRPLIAISQGRTTRYAIARLQAEVAGTE